MAEAEGSKTYFIESDVNSGEWSYGICHCCKNLDWCCIGCGLPGVLLMRIADQLKKVGQVKFILILLLLVMLFVAISDVFELMGANIDNDFAKIVLGGLAVIFALIALGFLIFYCVKVARLRGDIRQRYGIQGSDCKDCCVVCCCVATCGLHTCQMFQEVAAREGMDLA